LVSFSLPFLWFIGDCPFFFPFLVWFGWRDGGKVSFFLSGESFVFPFSFFFFLFFWGGFVSDGAGAGGQIVMTRYDSGVGICFSMPEDFFFFFFSLSISCSSGGWFV